MARNRVYRGVIYRQQSVLLDHLKRVGLARRRSLIPPEDLADWRTPKDVRPFQARPVPGRPDVYTEPWLVPKKIAGAIEDFYQPSAWATTPGLNVVRQSIATLKFFKTFGGLFQPIDYTMRTLAHATREADIRHLGTAVKAFARGYAPGLHRRMLVWDMQNPFRRTLVANGLNTMGGLDFMGGEWQRLAREMFLFRIPGFGRALRAFGSGAFENSHREFLLDTSEKVLRARATAERLAVGTPEFERAAAEIALNMNERFSALPSWQSVFRSPTLRDFIRAGVFSFLEQESWARMPFRQRGFLTAILLNTVIISNLVNLATTGKLLPLKAFIPLKPDEESPTRISYNPYFLRPELPWKGPDGRTLYLDILGQADTPLRFLGDPIFAAQSRVSQPIGIGGQLAAGRSWFGGKQIKTPKDIGLFLGEQVSPIPAGGFWGEQERIGLVGAGIQAAGLNVMAESLGSVLARKYEEKFGHPMEEDDPNTVSLNVIDDPELAAIQRKAQERGLELRIPSALAGETYRDARDVWQQRIADGIKANLPSRDILASLEGVTTPAPFVVSILTSRHT